MTPGFGLVTTSTGVTEAQCTAMAEALAIQWTRDLAPWWSLPPVQFKAFASVLDVPPGWVCALFTDTVAIPDDLAYHEELGGQPTIVIQVPVYAGAGVLVPAAGQVDCVSVGVSHEIAETACDPQTNLSMPFGTGSIALEIADPVQDNSYVIQTSAGPVSVSDFVTPYWFDKRLTTGLTFDKMGHVLFAVPDRERLCDRDGCCR